MALDITITDELRREGIARDIVNRIQNIRKSRDYDITDKISLRFEKNPDTDAAISTFKEYIASQVLADNVVLADSLPESAEILDIDGISLKASIDKIV